MRATRDSRQAGRLAAGLDSAALTTLGAEAGAGQQGIPQPPGWQQQQAFAFIASAGGTCTKAMQQTAARSQARRFTESSLGPGPLEATTNPSSILPKWRRFLSAET